MMMGAVRMKKNKKWGSRLCPEVPDFFERLPKDIIEKILMRLPLKEAARTSVLSRKWRCIWRNIPALIFDETFSGKLSGSLEMKFLDELVFVIYQIFLLHEAPVLKFTLSMPKLKSRPEIDNIFRYLSRTRLEDLTFEIFSGEKLPSHVFSCLHLKHLSLGSCEFIYPSSFQGFTKLLSLKLYDVSFSSSQAINTFISSCPFLEQLMFESFDALEHLEINAPNLQQLRIVANFKSMSFKNVPRLVDIYLASSPTSTVDSLSHVHWKASDVEEFSNCLPSVVNLEMDLVALKCLAAGNILEIPNRLSCLKKLGLTDIQFNMKDQISGTLWLIRNSPNLSSLKIAVYVYVDKGDKENDRSVLEFLRVQDYSDLSLNRLHEVRMEYLLGQKAEFEIMKILLAKSPNLKKFFIRPHDVKQQFNMLKRMLKFPRTSPKAEVIWI